MDNLCVLDDSFELVSKPPVVSLAFDLDANVLCFKTATAGFEVVELDFTVLLLVIEAEEDDMFVFDFIDIAEELLLLLFKVVATPIFLLFSRANLSSFHFCSRVSIKTV